MQVFLQFLGAVLACIALTDIFVTVLYPRADNSLLSLRTARGVWWLFRVMAQKMRKGRGSFLSYAGPIIIVAIIGVWVLLLLLGFALMVWPELGSAIQATQRETPTDFFTAIYYAGFSLTTLGTGDLVPQTATYRLLIILKSILGFSVFTLVLSYVTSVYSNLTDRNTFALSLHHRTADTADSAELLARLAADNNILTLHQDISQIAQDLIHLLESNNSYPVLFYFRYRQIYYTLPRILYLTMDVATLLKTAFDPEKYRSVTNSSGAVELWYGGNHMLEELCRSLVPKVYVKKQDSREAHWRSHYFQALKRFEAEGIKTVSDPEAGADSYVALRHQWAPNLDKLIHYMGYESGKIFDAEFCKVDCMTQG